MRGNVRCKFNNSESHILFLHATPMSVSYTHLMLNHISNFLWYEFYHYQFNVTLLYMSSCNVTQNTTSVVHGFVYVNIT